MKFSTKTTYGLRAMVFLGENYPSSSISLSQIAKEEGISIKYLERIFKEFKKSGIIKSEKGAAGGYSLLLAPDKISIYQIISALEGELNIFRCITEKGKIICGKKKSCKITFVLVKMQESMQKVLKSIKLSDLLS